MLGRRSWYRFTASCSHLRRPLMSLSLLSSSSFLKSLVFCASSFLWVRVSRWCVTRSEATVSSWGMSAVRSMSGAWSALRGSFSTAAAYCARLQWPSGTCCPPLSPAQALPQLAPVLPLAPRALPRPGHPPWRRLQSSSHVRGRGCAMVARARLCLWQVLLACVVAWLQVDTQLG